MVFAIFIIGFSVRANDRTTRGIDSSLVIIADDPILAMMDSLMSQKFFESKGFTTDTFKLNKMGYAPEIIPSFDDVVYQERMARLDAKSPFTFVYSNVIKSYIKLYAERKRNVVSRMIGLSQIYFPLFEEKLDKYKLPEELKYLAIVESALNPNATSVAGAAGLWQFMYGTGKAFGLDVNSYVDERRDPIQATEAACKYFKFLYNIFGDWQLVLAAYNGGPGTVNKAIRRSGGKKNYWEIRPFLPLETQGYVPAFMAVNYVMNYTSEHNLYPIAPKAIYFQTDTVAIKQSISFKQVSAVLNLPTEDIAYLNPQYKLQIIPFTGEQGFICLPSSKVGSFINNENNIYAYKTKEERLDSTESANTQNRILVEEKKWHKVKRGETLKAIAAKYGCTVKQLKVWNGLRGSKAPTGKMLAIVTRDYKIIPQSSNPLVSADSTKNNNSEIALANKASNATDSTSLKKEKQSDVSLNKQSKTKFIYYTVQRGDTLWSIANRKGVTVDELKKLNNLRSSLPLKAGVKLKISVKG